MKQILVTGGTGTLGKTVVQRLLNLGFQPTILSTRKNPDVPTGTRLLTADLTKRESLEDVIKGVDIIIHCASNPKNSEEVDVKGTRNLLEALHKTSFTHLIYLSIVGIDKSTYPYYVNKLRVEKMIQESKIPWSILRVTQFHDFVLNRIINSSENKPNATFKIPKGLKFQPIDVEDVTKNIIQLVISGPANSTSILGGPEILSIEEMTHIYLRETGKADTIEEVFVENDFYNIFRSGINLRPEYSVGVIKWRKFLKNNFKK